MSGSVEETDLTRVLRDPALSLPDDLVDLHQVHATARARQRRRTVAAAGGAVAAVVLVGLIAARPWQDATPPVPDASNVVPSTVGTSPDPSAPSPAQSTADAVLTTPVVGITAISADTWWVLAGSDRRCLGICPTSLFATTDGGRSFRVVSQSPDAGGVPAGTTEIRFLTKDLAWALRPAAPVGQQLWSSVDGGATWSLPPYPPTVHALALEAGGGRGWVLVRDSRRVGVAELVPGLMENPQRVIWLGPNLGPAPVLTVHDGDAVVLWYDENGSRGSQVSGSPPVVGLANPCSPDLGVGSISATANGIAVSCHTGTADQPYVSVDGARTWSPLGLFGDQEAQRFVVGSIDGGLTAIGGQDGTITLAEPSGTGTPVKPRHGEVANTEPWTYLGFTDAQHGFGITANGVLYRTTDGGLTWIRAAGGP